MAMVGIEEIFLGVADVNKAIAFLTRGPMGERGEGRTLFMFDPNGNETEVNTRYLYGVPKR